MHPAFAIDRNASTQPTGRVSRVASMSITTTTGTGTTPTGVRTGVSS